jgi:hypothetical protein
VALSVAILLVALEETSLEKTSLRLRSFLASNRYRLDYNWVSAMDFEAA